MDRVILDAVRHPISRRQFLRRSAGLVAGTLLAGCVAPAAPSGEVPVAAATNTVDTGAVSEPTASSGEVTTLKILHNNWGELYNRLMTKIGDDYTAKHPNVKLEWEFNEEWQTKLLTQIAGNTSPDATYSTPAAQASLASKGTFLDLDSYIAAEGLTRDDFVTPMYDMCQWDGKLYALPGGADYIALFWSKNLYEEVGLDPEQPPKTADELIAHSEKILKKEANGDISRLGYSPAPEHFVRWAYIFGGEFYDSASKTVTANHPANVEALEWMLDYVKQLGIDKLTAFNQRPGSYQAGNTFASKQSAYLFDGFWAYDALDQYSPDIDYGVTLWPTLKGTSEEMKNYQITGWFCGIPKNAKNPDAAWQFMKYAFVDEAAKMGYMTLNAPCVKKSFPAFEAGLKKQIGADNRLVPYIDVFIKTGAEGTKGWPVMPVNGFYFDELTRIYDFVMRGEKTPKDALDEVTKNVEAELAKVS